MRKTFAKEGQQSTVFAWELIAQSNNAGLIYMQGQVIHWTNKWVDGLQPSTHLFTIANKKLWHFQTSADRHFHAR